MKIIEYFDEKKILILKAYNCILGLPALARLGLFSISPQVNLLDLVWLEFSEPHHLVTAYISPVDDHLFNSSLYRRGPINVFCRLRHRGKVREEISK